MIDASDSLALDVELAAPEACRGDDEVVNAREGDAGTPVSDLIYLLPASEDVASSKCGICTGAGGGGISLL